MNKIDLLFRQYILNEVKILIPHKHKRQYSDEHFLIFFELMLKDYNYWKSLTTCRYYPENKKNHYKYINEIYNLWCDKNIFYNAYHKLFNDTYYGFKKIKKSTYINLFIDSTFVTNKYGQENITFNPQYKKKKVTKLSIISDENKNILSVINCMPKYNNNKYIKTFNADVKDIQKTVNNMHLNIPNYIRKYLIGDKGYITNDNIKINNIDVKIITPKRKNQKTKNSKFELNKLNNRYKVEHSISSLKKYDRIMIRKDKLINTYMGYVYLGMLINYSKSISHLLTHY